MDERCQKWGGLLLIGEGGKKVGIVAEKETTILYASGHKTLPQFSISPELFS